MECSIEAKALKSSFYSETGGSVKAANPQAFLDDFWCVTGISNNVVNSDDFSVDVFLNLSDKDFKTAGSFEDYSEEDEEKDNLSVSSLDNDVNSNSSAFSGDGNFQTVPAGELAVPVDEMENLEWLSQFVDDSATGMSLLCPAGSFKEKTGKCFTTRFEPASRPPVQKYSVLGFLYPVPRRPRTLRSRRSQRVWPIGSLVPAESSTSSSSYDSSVTSPVLFTTPVRVMDSFWAFGKRPPAKKQKRNPSSETTGSGMSGSQLQRRCSHCHVQKTPQWRTGPLGPKTLCNACGVRFKSGRLFPEYRPACSPTFSMEAHSNSHRKVLEMRRKKEMSEVTEPGLAPMVPSF